MTLMTLVPCARCHRHVGIRALACPFCAEPCPSPALSSSSSSSLPASSSSSPLSSSSPSPSLSPSRLGRISRAAVFAGLGACWTSSTPSTPPTRPPPPPPPANAAVTTTVEPTGERVAVTGKVTDAGTNTPLAHVNVELRDEHGRVAVAMTDETGRYELAEVVPGEYQLVFVYATYMERGSAQQPVIVRDGKPVRVDIALPLMARAPVAKPYGAPPARSRIV